MAESAAFTALTQELERCSSFDRLEARGTVRIAIKNAGLDIASVGKRELIVVVEKLFLDELEARGVDDGERVCDQLIACMKALPDSDARDGAERPEDIFGRLGR